MRNSEKQSRGRLGAQGPPLWEVLTPILLLCPAWHTRHGSAEQSTTVVSHHVSLGTIVGALGLPSTEWAEVLEDVGLPKSRVSLNLVLNIHTFHTIWSPNVRQSP